MRIKYKKGVSPELILAHLAEYMEDKIIGTVNVYIQEYDDNMKPIKDEKEYIVLEAANRGLERYSDYVADQRRKRMKIV